MLSRALIWATNLVTELFIVAAVNCKELVRKRSHDSFINPNKQLTSLLSVIPEFSEMI